jgi:preprotein translocase subunit SecF
MVANLNFDFMKLRKAAMIISAVLLLLSIASLATKGLNFGLDFTGGTLLEVS